MPSGILRLTTMITSKPGAPAAAVFLHHEVIGLDEKGHGMLLGEVCFTSSRVRIQL